MFTGIVEGMARIESIVPHGAAYRFCLDLGPVVEGLKIGDSVAVEGACLTVVTLRGTKAEFDVIRETVERTAFATLRTGQRVNVERPMRADGRFHGHLVSGHVDGTGRVKVKRLEAGQTWFTVEVPRRLTSFMVEKGSVTLGGVSLTLTEVTEKSFSVALIPHTLEVTTLGQKSEGDLINVEIDQLAKFVHKLLGAYLPSQPGADEGEEEAKLLRPSAALGLTLEHLKRTGFASES
jgi:riboflavin synthase